MKVFVKCLAILFLLTSSKGALSAFIDTENYILDTTTNLQWLKFSSSRGVSPENLQQFIESQSSLNGYKLANSSQVSGLLDSILGPINGNALSAGAVNSFINLFGSTTDYLSNSFLFSSAIYQNEIQSNELRLVSIYCYFGGFENGCGAPISDTERLASYTGYSSIVPSPSTKLMNVNTLLSFPSIQTVTDDALFLVRSSRQQDTNINSPRITLLLLMFIGIIIIRKSTVL